MNFYLISSLFTALLLKFLQAVSDHEHLIPVFYIAVPALFYLVSLLSGVSIDELRGTGWLLHLDVKNAPLYTFWTFYDINAVNWRTWALTIPTQLALSFFGLLHVPINGFNF